MAKKKLKKPVSSSVKKNTIIDSSSGQASSTRPQNRFHLEFLNDAQKKAWSLFDKHDVLFLLGPAGCGKSHLACAFAINEILAKRKEKIVLTRPIIEAGEALGFLPGTMDEKVLPYMLPMYDCISRTVGKEGPQREMVNKSLDLAPLAYMRGRSLLNSELVLTPSGYKKMGEIKVGDLAIGLNGNPIKVVGVYPQGKIPYAKMSFSDGTQSLCSWDHLWASWTRDEKSSGSSLSIASTKQISETLFDSKGLPNHEIPLIKSPVKFVSKPILIDPYVLGVLIAGCNNFYSPKIGPIKNSIIQECIKNYDEISFSCLPNKNYRLFLGEAQATLEALGLLDTELDQRFVPDDFKINSVDIRLKILRGIMDVCGQTGSDFSLSLKSEALADDVLFTVRSLGGFGKKELKNTSGSLLYNVSFSLDKNPFKIKSKSNKVKLKKINFPRKMVVAVEPVSEDLCTCISVDDADHLFVTEGFTLTHNTFHDAVCIFDEAQNATKTQLKLFLTRFGQNSKVIITGDPKQSDLRTSEQSLMDVVKNLEDLPGIGVIYFNSDSIVRHPLIASILERLEDK